MSIIIQYLFTRVTNKQTQNKQRINRTSTYIYDRIIFSKLITMAHKERGENKKKKKERERNQGIEI